MIYHLDERRLRADFEAINRFGYRACDGGVDRPAFGDADMAARRWLLETLLAAGIEARMDGAGNVIGRYGDAATPAVAVGSHIDSVPAGGQFDGALGVVAGLAILRFAVEKNLQLAHPLELIATSDEEGRFGGMFGAQALVGQIDSAWLERAVDADGVRLVEAMAAQGLVPAQALTVRREPGSLKAFLELHIEQGPVLESEGLDVGLVTGISGVFSWLIRLDGRADHSGTTPMEVRRDALAGMADFAHAIPTLIAAHGSDDSRLTIGKVDLTPNFPHTIPGCARFTLVGRDSTTLAMERLAEGCREALLQSAQRHSLALSVTQLSWLHPRFCDLALVALMQEQAEQLGLKETTMLCGAGHDTQFLAEITRAGLLLVPSRGGISHAPDEYTPWEAAVKGADLLLNTALTLAMEA